MNTTKVIEYGNYNLVGTDGKNDFRLTIRNDSESEDFDEYVVDIDECEPAFRALKALGEINQDYLYVLAEFFEAGFRFGAEELDEQEKGYRKIHQPCVIIIETIKGDQRREFNLFGRADNLLEAGDRVIAMLIIQEGLSDTSDMQDFYQSLDIIDARTDFAITNIMRKFFTAGYENGVRKRMSSSNEAND